MKGLQPATLYTYQVIAYSATEVSDTSNSSKVTTPAIPEIFNKPFLNVYWNIDTSKSVRIMIVDNANCETGYRIYRDDNFSSSFNLVAQIVSAKPVNIDDTIVWFDNTISNNKWYNYRVAAYKTGDSVFSEPCSTYAFHGMQTQQVVKFTKLSAFPITMVSGLSWSAKAGDSIILKEDNSPAGKYSIINIKDPAIPKFDGYVDSAILSSYPIKTLIPVYLKIGRSNNYSGASVINYKDRILSLDGSAVLRMYQIQNNNLALIDSLQDNSLQEMILLNDTLLGVITASSEGHILVDSVRPFYLSASGFSPLPAYFLGKDNPGTQYWGYQSYIHGAYDNKILISVDYNYNGLPSTYNYAIINYDAFLRRIIMLPGAFPSANIYNTGNRISLTENLCTNGFGFGARNPSDFLPMELFVSDLRVNNPYQADSLSNAVYRDTIHKQNDLRDILLDTVAHNVFLLFKDQLTILKYQHETAGVVHNASTSSYLKTLTIRPCANGVAIILPQTYCNADLYFFNLSGRLIDKISNLTSNAVFWRPKTRSTNCYIVMVKSGREQYLSKFIVR
jgi:hypothetical protein